ncbi:MAG: AMP-binding protein [Bacteriovoracaceae bacterium]|nr:AMP-binding protein [Bacteriovoracaceae bacterium]
MNIAHRLTNFSKINPNKKAVLFPIWQKETQNYFYDSLTFKELEIRSNKFAIGLKKLGLKKGDKTLLFLKPSLDFSAMTFALFKLGVIPVFIDPGMGRKNLLKCIKEASPVALIAEKEVHFARLLFFNNFKSIKFNVTTAKRSWGKMISLAELKKEKIQTFESCDFESDETAAILFTSGGTGAPKGVVYSHGIFENQTTMLQDMYGLSDSDIDMPGFPLFALFTIAMGMTSCIPDMDPSKPGECDPKKIIQNIKDCSPTFVAGSPAIWERVADYCLKKDIILPSIKYVVMFGAPVSVSIHRKFKNLLPNGTTYTPYGATEALPVSHINGDYILKNTASQTEKGIGTCNGLPVFGMQVKIIRISDDIIENLRQAHQLSPMEIGEIIVKGPTVTKEYFDLPLKTKEAKISDGEHFWHRMGDIGYIDLQGNIWFLGRKAHRVETKEHGLLTPISCEAIFNQHPDVKRSALVGLGPLGEQEPVIVIERKDGLYLSGKERSAFEQELLKIAKKYPHTQMIQKIYLSKHFPVDVRHNIKIDRQKLKEEIEAHETH